MAVNLPGGDIRNAGPPVPVFQSNLESSGAFDQFASSPDGQRFLLRRSPNRGGGGDRAPVRLIVNFDPTRPSSLSERPVP